MNCINTKNLNVSYGNTDIIKNLNLVKIIMKKYPESDIIILCHYIM